ncbi:hypothetical protein BA768_13855 [Chryseobacterium sp. CBo1]|uniref:hypothetical protein n=1 Tax=Chryseobacterium sp. CBo1 TaxID=1869230 RepID=UPI000810AE4E|nr:hypothetical protein [Chryseobacterium sp. CBo1]OCK52010.1 hypothetical protein BA768_13855 [Chryseobacterium sp. CBo1]
MKNIIQLLILIITISSCKPAISTNKDIDSIIGSYKLKSGNKIYQALSEKNYDKIVLNVDSTYLLYHAQANFSPAIEQCDLASKGKWLQISKNVISLVSEDNYLKQDGFKYELKEEKRYSQDSIYFNVEFPTEYRPVDLTFTFNNSKRYNTDKLHISLPKKKYLQSYSPSENLIDFSLNANISGTKTYEGRILFDIFSEKIDTYQNNYFTIKLPYFDECFFEFEHYDHSLIYRKNKNTIFWKGLEWVKE